MGLFDIFKVNEYKERIATLEKERKELGFQEYKDTQAAIEKMRRDAEIAIREKQSAADQKLEASKKRFEDYEQQAEIRRETVLNLLHEQEKIDKQLKTSTNKLNKSKELYRAIEYSLSHSHPSELWEIRRDEYEGNPPFKKLTEEEQALFDELAPTVSLNLHCMDMRDLRKAYRENEKQIDKVVEAYKKRYTTKTNKTIYELMVIALRAELQNILYVLKYEKLDKGIESIKEVTAKYLAICTEGNQTIAPTMTKFIGEIEYLFINAVKIEYNYYVKKEQAKQEQMAIREQMRQEAEERRALEQEKKRVEAEEQKYKNEIERLKEQLASADESAAVTIQAEIAKVESNLSDVVIKKEEIVNLQNGKAGNVYIISNLGSFGENMFKIGMTRRLDPQDRVNELSSAAVPFKFDVHSFIFSDDAVSLEAELHKRLDDKRVNKVNLRKEFFYSSVDELEALTMEISPSAEFHKTMLAEEFRQSLSSDKNYTSDYHEDGEEDEED